MFKTLWDTWKQDRLFQRVIRNTGFLFSSNTINMGLSVLQGSFAAHLLGVHGLGVLGIITMFASTVNRLLSFRMGELVVKYLGVYLNEKRADKAAALVKIAVMTEGLSSIIAFILLIVLSPLAAYFLAHDPATTPWFIIYGLIIPGNLVTETATGVLQIDNRYREQAAVNVTQGFVTALIIILAFFSNGGLPMVVMAYLLGKLILGITPMVLAWGSLNKMLGKDWWQASLVNLPPWRELVSFGLGTNFSATVNLVVRDSEVLWVAYFLSPVEAGYFKVALAINNLLLMPITPFISTTYPEFSRCVAAKAWQQLRGLLRRVTMVSGGWTLLAALGLVLFGPWVIILYGGPEYVPAYPAMLVMLLGFGVANTFFWNRALVLAFNLPGFALRSMVIAGVVKTLLAFLLVPRFGYLAEAGLLTAFFGISVGLITWRGLQEMKQAERQIASL